MRFIESVNFDWFDCIRFHPARGLAFKWPRGHRDHGWGQSLRLINLESSNAENWYFLAVQPNRPGVTHSYRARSWLTPFLLAILVGPLSSAFAGEEKEAAERERVDTEFIFGFTAGADTGEVGEHELEHQTAAQWGKRDGRYGTVTDQLRYETSPVQNFRFEIGAPIAYYNISGVPGLDDRNQGSLNGLIAEFKYRLFDRDHAPFGLMVSVEPHWNRTDEISGARIDGYGGEVTLVLEKELLKDRLFAAVNFVYDPEIARSQGQWQRESMLGFSASVTTQVKPGVFIGGEARYLRRYDGVDLDSLAGQAFFLGPNFLVQLSKSLSVSGAWSVQVAGHATAVPCALDLTTFARQQALFRVEYKF